MVEDEHDHKPWRDERHDQSDRHCLDQGGLAPVGVGTRAGEDRDASDASTSDLLFGAYGHSNSAKALLEGSDDTGPRAGLSAESR